MKDPRPKLRVFLLRGMSAKRFPPLMVRGILREILEEILREML
jgi:hypothetical protein